MLKVLSWNIEGGLSETATDRSGKILERIRKIDADVVFLAESHIGKMPDKTLRELQKYVGSSGSLVDVKYRKAAQKPMNYEKERIEKYGSNENYMTMISRRKVESNKVFMLGGCRNCIRFEVGNMAIYGIHLDDKTEETRRTMVRDLLKDAQKFKCVVVMGDFNAMYRNGFRAVLVRVVGKVGSILPFGPLWQSIFRRAADMAKGKVMKEFLKSGLVDTNTKKKPTETLSMEGARFIPRIPLIQIDHIMVRGGKFNNFKIYNTGLADHCALSARIDK